MKIISSIAELDTLEHGEQYQIAPIPTPDPLTIRSREDQEKHLEAVRAHHALASSIHAEAKKRGICDAICECVKCNHMT